jgi:hypothetical protein
MLVNFAKVETGDTAFDNMINGSLDLATKRYSGEKIDEADYAKKNADLLVNIGANITADDKYAAKKFADLGLRAFRDPMVVRCASVHRNFDVIISQITTAVIPTVVNDVYSKFLAEVHNGGWGDTGRFIIESNDLFKVNLKAEGVRAGVQQPMYNDEFTLNAKDYEISTGVDWYNLATGVFDIGNFALKIGRSFEAHIFLKIIAAMISASSEFGAAYNTNGVTPTLWGTLAQRVSAANGGMSVVAIGTKVALSNVSLLQNFQIQIGEEMNKVGYLDQYLGIPLVAIENVIIPGTVNSTAALAISDKIIYMIPMGGSRPVKIFMEGNQVSLEEDTTHTSDREYRFWVDLHYEVSAIVGYKYGTITLA